METIKFDFTGVFEDVIGGENGLSRAELDAQIDKAGAAHEKLAQTRSRGEIGFYDLADETGQIEKIQDMAKRVQSRYENLLVLGIGGSALGMRCLAQALLSPYYNSLPARGRNGCPKLYVCDNIDPDYFEPLFELLDWKQTCVNVISKSGRTTETMAQFFLVKDILVKKFGRDGWRDHVIVTTDPNTGPLRRIAREENLASLPVPINVGGRFSVLSPVGLLPAACCGININELLEGASDMVRRCSEPNIDNNPAYMNALIHYIFDSERRRNISVMMPYSDGLDKFSDWYSQLFAESLGKSGKGPTPVKALGVTDQHSQLQLYMDGPQDKVITIVGVGEFSHGTKLPRELHEPFEYLSEHSLIDVIKAEEKATIEALKQAFRPVVTLTLPKLCAYSMGQLFMAYQIQIAYAGMLYGINPFNQPGVELGKKITKEKLLSIAD